MSEQLDKALAERAAILDEIVREITPNAIAPDEFTIADVLARAKTKDINANRDNISNIVKRLTDEGKLTFRFCRVNGKRVKVYKVME